jgi:DNA-directed RNA polymerase specialized sigma24 family protein
VRTQSIEAAESALALLIQSHIEPVIKGIIRFKLRLDSAGRTDEADLAQEALAQWLAELRKLSAGSDGHSIGDAHGLAATIAYRVCYGWLRRRSPRRHALRNRLQYVLTRQAGLALWADEGRGRQGRKMSIAGFAARRDRPPSPSEKLRQLPGDDKFLARAGHLITERNDRRDARLNDLLAAIFDYAGGPVAFDDLLSVTAALLQIDDEPDASVEELQELGGAELASGGDVPWQVEKRIRGRLRHFGHRAKRK